MPRLSDAQREARRSQLGASDVAVIAGVSPWKKPFDLYLEKIGELDPVQRASQGDLDRQERGHRLEDVALDWHAEINGIAIERIRRDVRHPRLPFVVVHPDARVKPWRSTRRLLEAKTSARRWDEIPQHVEAQVQMQMAATGADVADVVVLGFDGPPAPFEVPRNPELIEALEDLAARFWQRVIDRDPPPIDGSVGASRWLDRLFRDEAPIEADADQAALLRRILDIRELIPQLEAEDRELANRLKHSMAGAMRLRVRGVGDVLWTKPFERRDVAWKAIAEGLLTALPDDEREALVSIHTTVTPDVRQFRPTRYKPPKEKSA